MPKQIDITLIYVVAAIAVLVGIGLLAYTFLPRSFGTSIVTVPSEQEETSDDSCEYRRVLDGACVVSIAETNPRLVAVMVENHFESWPQSGIADARVVYEAPVEGNISRFLLLYTEDQVVDKIGPVRSARPYYLDWLAEYGTPLYMHVGGSPAALSRITSEGLNDLNEFYRGWYYWRDQRRYAPHNVYTSSEQWTEALERYESGYSTDTYDGWQFGEVVACTDDCVMDIEIVYSGLTYTAGWEYNSSTERYARTQAGDAHDMADGEIIESDTIIVQYVDTTVLDGVGRLGMETIGTGDAIVFQKGTAVEGEWRKDGVNERTRWYLGDKEIVLNPGQVWVQVINRDAVVYE